ncbi:MAG: hypothetical protein ACTSYM_05765 [Candidatus Baldrarchaeia archaeon]
MPDVGKPKCEGFEESEGESCTHDVKGLFEEIKELLRDAFCGIAPDEFEINLGFITFKWNVRERVCEK